MKIVVLIATATISMIATTTHAPSKENIFWIRTEPASGDWKIEKGAADIHKLANKWEITLYDGNLSKNRENISYKLYIKIDQFDGNNIYKCTNKKIYAIVERIGSDLGASSFTGECFSSRLNATDATTFGYKNKASYYFTDGASGIAFSAQN